jgi:starch phosphorylase
MSDIKIKTFKVMPDVPEKLTPLYDIAYNIKLYWTPDTIKLFTRMDSKLWDNTRHNPVKMLGEIKQERLNELAADEGYVLEVSRIHKNLQEYLDFSKTQAPPQTPSIGYFSLEYGLTEALPIYSGGLGVLAGDHIKSSSDLGIDLKGIGLLYQLGYFRQYLNKDGWQQDFHDTNDFYNMPIKEELDKNGQAVEIEVQLPGRTLFLKVWRLSAGRVTIYLMDSNIDKNSPNDQKLTAQLYGGDREMRLQQEIILGIGGIRLLDRLGIHVDAIHMNEGHSSFAIFERAHRFMTQQNLSFEEALEVTRKTAVFTTHTPVPAGNDEFHPDLVKRYFTEYCKNLGISIDFFLSFGRIKPEDKDSNFSMPVLAIRQASYVNGVSKLHGEIAQAMWKHLWQDVPTEHIPIGHVTNGVHLASWLSIEMMELFRRYLGDNWQEKQDQLSRWQRTENIPDPELWRVHCVRRRRLIYFIRERLKKQLIEKGASPQLIKESQEALDPEVLTIGFARRFATYKRGDLIFRDIERLMKLVDDALNPVQLIFAGKAHPQDHAGKEIIKRIIHALNDNRLWNRIVFIEDYDMNVARYMVQGVDVWLNNPLRPHEASGTSGMKAAVNGALNLSVLDGWWDEAYDHNNGWAIGSGEVYDDRGYQDEVESKTIYSIIENDIIPMFYEHSPDGLPREWIKMMKNAFITVTSFFNTHRMIKEYGSKFYHPAGKNYTTLSQENFKQAKELVQWKNNMRNEFKNIQIGDLHFDDTKVYKINDHIPIETEVFTGNLEPEDINVDIYYGNITGNHQLSGTAIQHLTEIKPLENGKYLFSGHLPCQKTGKFGLKIRITPSHPLIINPYEMNLVLWK